MDTVVLVEGTMASGMVDCGGKLLRALDREGLHPDAMYWEYDEECREWFLQIITRRMDMEDNFHVIRRVHKGIDGITEVQQLLRPSYFAIRGVRDPGYQVSRQRMPYGRGAGEREWANRDFYCYRLG